MLVLTRKQDQEIKIGNNVTITILKVRGNTVRIGIDAPREIPVIRGELELEVNSAVANATGPVTIEFKTNSSTPNEKTGMRIVNETNPGRSDPIFLPQNRLRQIVAKMGQLD